MVKVFLFRRELSRTREKSKMIVLPWPAIIVIPIGLGILATEFIWAGGY